MAGSSVLGWLFFLAPAVFLALVFFFVAAFFFFVAFFFVAFFFVAPAFFFFLTGPRSRRICSSSDARSSVIVSTSSPLRSDALTSPSVT